jgi:hypothetical protein
MEFVRGSLALALGAAGVAGVPGAGAVAAMDAMAPSAQMIVGANTCADRRGGWE